MHAVPDKNPRRSKDANQQPKDNESAMRTRDTLVEDECYHHCSCAIPAPQHEFRVRLACKGVFRKRLTIRIRVM